MPRIPRINLTFVGLIILFAIILFVMSLPLGAGEILIEARAIQADSATTVTGPQSNVIAQAASQTDLLTRPTFAATSNIVTDAISLIPPAATPDKIINVAEGVYLALTADEARLYQIGTVWILDGAYGYQYALPELPYPVTSQEYYIPDPGIALNWTAFGGDLAISYDVYNFAGAPFYGTNTLSLWDAQSELSATLRPQVVTNVLKSFASTADVTNLVDTVQARGYLTGNAPALTNATANNLAVVGTLSLNGSGVDIVIARTTNYLGRISSQTVTNTAGGAARTDFFTHSCTIPKTGQLSSLALHDDGAIRAGAVWPVPRFQILDAATNCVRDLMSGLVWSGNANVITNTAWDTGGLCTWANIQWAVSNLNATAYAGRTDWRAPNVREMNSLINYEIVGSPYVPDITGTQVWTSARGPWRNIRAEGSARYWTSTSYGPIKGTWAMYHALEGNSAHALKTTAYPVWLVAGPDL